jgi:hypothetical protein
MARTEAPLVFDITSCNGDSRIAAVHIRWGNERVSAVEAHEVVLGSGLMLLTDGECDIRSSDTALAVREFGARSLRKRMGAGTLGKPNNDRWLLRAGTGGGAYSVSVGRDRNGLAVELRIVFLADEIGIP